MDNNQYKEILKQKKDLFELLLKKTKTKKEDIFLMAMEEFINANLDELTSTEISRFDKLIFPPSNGGACVRLTNNDLESNGDVVDADRKTEKSKMVMNPNEVTKQDITTALKQSQIVQTRNLSKYL
ncbi:MAG: hypothetical protein MJZ01_05955 [Bacteroidales bacterium]|nr:hypothetical protein [Bacteroidales bacterium]